MENETWKKVIGFNGTFQVSSFGRIKRIAGVTHYKDGRKRFYPERYVKACKTKDGYLIVGLSGEGVITNEFVHRIVAKAFIANPEDKPNINHKNGTRDDNRAENLEWCTQSENLKYSYEVLGYKVSQQTKNKLSNSLRGKKKSPEHIEKVRQANSLGNSYRAIKLIDIYTLINYDSLKSYAIQNSLNYHTIKGRWRRGLLTNLSIIDNE